MIARKQNMNKTNDLPSDNKTYIKWDDLKVAHFQQLLSSKQNLLEELKDMVCNNENIDEFLSSFTDILQETTLNVFGYKSSMPGNENRKLHTRNRNGLMKSVIMQEKSLTKQGTRLLETRLLSTAKHLLTQNQHTTALNTLIGTHLNQKRKYT